VIFPHTIILPRGRHKKGLAQNNIRLNNFKHIANLEESELSEYTGLFEMITENCNPTENIVQTINEVMYHPFWSYYY